MSESSLALERHLRARIPDLIGDKLESTSARIKVENALSKLYTASRDHYETISVLSIYWRSDDTGSKEDSHKWLPLIYDKFKAYACRLASIA